MMNILNLTDRKRIFLYILASIVLFYFILSPAITILYYAADDYRYALGGLNKACGTDDGFYFVLTLGRPLQGYMDCWNYKFGYTLEHMKIIRFISVLLMGWAAGLFADWLFRRGFSLVASFLAAGSLFLIYQLYPAAILMGAGTIIFPLVLVLLAYRICARNLFFSAILLLIALLIYPAMTFFFPTLILGRVLFSNLASWTETRRAVIQEIALFCGTCLLYFIYAYFNMRFNAYAPIPDAYHLDRPNVNPIEVFKRFAFLGHIFNRLWSLLPSGNMLLQGYTMLILLFGGIIIAASRFSKKIPLSFLIQALIAVLGLFMLSSGFILVMPSFEFLLNTGEHWLLFGTLSAAMVLMFWSTMQWSSLFPQKWQKTVLSAVLGVFFFTEAYQANIMITARALGFNHYLNFVKSAMADHLTDNNILRRVHFIVPTSEYPYDSFFAANAALVQLLGHGKYNVQWCSLPRGVEGLEKDHQEEAMRCIENLSQNSIGITYSYPNEPFQTTKSLLVIDMQKSNTRNDYFNLSLKNYLGIEGWLAY